MLKFLVVVILIGSFRFGEANISADSASDTASSEGGGWLGPDGEMAESGLFKGMGDTCGPNDEGGVDFCILPLLCLCVDACEPTNNEPPICVECGVSHDCRDHIIDEGLNMKEAVEGFKETQFVLELGETCGSGHGQCVPGLACWCPPEDHYDAAGSVVPCFTDDADFVGTCAVVSIEDHIQNLIAQEAAATAAPEVTLSPFVDSAQSTTRYYGTLCVAVAIMLGLAKA